MDAHDWDERYAAHDLVWSATPNRFVEELIGPLPPGSAIDIAAGEGRNAIWLAGRGWTVTGCDYSPVAVDRMRELAAQALGDDVDRLTPVVADATAALPGGTAAYDVALFSYLQLPETEMRAALRHAVDGVRVGGQVVVIGHAGRNLTEGQGGPSDRSVLYDPDEVLQRVAGLPVEVISSEIRTRPVDTPEGTRDALDTVVVLRRT